MKRDRKKIICMENYEKISGSKVVFETLGRLCCFLISSVSCRVFCFMLIFSSFRGFPENAKIKKSVHATTLTTNNNNSSNNTPTFSVNQTFTLQQKEIFLHICCPWHNHFLII